MNKGIALATGDVVGTLNADDFYMNDHVLEEVAQVFSDASIEACYGNLVYVNQNDVNQVVRFWKSNDYKPGLFKSGWMPAHPTFFVRKSVYERLGNFSLDYKIAADFELLFRFIEQKSIRTKYIPKVLVKMRLGGTTNKNLSNVMAQNKEIIAILRKHYIDFSIIRFFFKKLINRFFQFTFHPEH
jgi:glycosyltransferase involved in cell wall biosynthesis